MQNPFKFILEVKVKKNATILNVLLDDNYNRDEKINIINEVMTNLFPQLEGDKVTFIGSTFMKYGEKEPYMNHCLVLDTCDNIEGIDVVSVDNEKDLLIKWTELIQPFLKNFWKIEISYATNFGRNYKIWDPKNSLTFE